MNLPFGKFILKSRNYRFEFKIKKACDCVKTTTTLLLEGFQVVRAEVREKAMNWSRTLFVNEE